jgi:hypothetical protein
MMKTRTSEASIRIKWRGESDLGEAIWYDIDFEYEVGTEDDLENFAESLCITQIRRRAGSGTDEQPLPMDNIFDEIEALISEGLIEINRGLISATEKAIDLVADTWPARVREQAALDRAMAAYSDASHGR